MSPKVGREVEALLSGQVRQLLPSQPYSDSEGSGVFEVVAAYMLGWCPGIQVQ